MLHFEVFQSIHQFPSAAPSLLMFRRTQCLIKVQPNHIPGIMTLWQFVASNLNWEISTMVSFKGLARAAIKTVGLQQLW